MNDVELVGIKQEIREVTYDDFVERIKELLEKKDNIQWEVGDTAIVMTEKFSGKVISQLSKDTGIDAATVRRYRDVSKAYPVWFREEVGILSWSHFRQVAARPDRQEVLRRAHDENWTIKKLRVMTQPDQSKVIDDGMIVPPQPPMLFCRDPKCRKWYPEFADDICKHRGVHPEHDEVE